MKYRLMITISYTSYLLKSRHGMLDFCHFKSLCMDPILHNLCYLSQLIRFKNELCLTEYSP